MNFAQLLLPTSEERIARREQDNGAAINRLDVRLFANLASAASILSRTCAIHSSDDNAEFLFRRINRHGRVLLFTTLPQLKYPYHYRYRYRDNGRRRANY